MKNKYVVLGILVGALVFTCACGMVSTLLGGKTSGSVSELWADVPRMDGLTKTDLDMPLAAQLALRAVMQGRMDFIAYTTESTPQAVLDFYSADRMQGQGWSGQDGAGCFGDAESSAEGTVCIYTKEVGGKNEILGIIAAKDSESGKTAIFFARVDATEAATEEPSN